MGSMHDHVVTVLGEGGSRRCFLVESDGGGVKGFIVVRFGSTCVVEYLVVDKAARRLGIATALLLEAEAYVKEKDATSLHINVVSIQEAAVKFYLKRGYNRCSTKVLNGYGENEIEMQKIF